MRSRGGALRLVCSGAAGYLLGTIPSADAAARLATGGRADLRATGSGNPGAANAMAVLGSRWGYGVLAADVGKGAAACLVGRRLAGADGSHLAGTAAVVGHCFPVWSGFRGGKGVATSVGQCLVTFPAYFPVDLAVAGLASSRRWRSRAFATTAVASLGWCAGALAWWRRGWSNAWGPSPSVMLPCAAAASSAVILYRFATSRPAGPQSAAARASTISPCSQVR
jgi:glycerol-3-phosphate acyltransferase PlsY